MNFPMPGGSGGGGGPMSTEEQRMVNLWKGVFESCAAKSAMAGVMGAGLGAMFGVFMTSMRYDTPLSTPTAPGQPSVPLYDLPLRQQLRAGLTDMRKTAVSSGRNFGTIGLIYAGSECCIEGLRGRNDMTNAIAAGGVTGAILARRQGPVAVAWSAVGFAAFSWGIELWMRSPEKERRYPVI